MTAIGNGPGFVVRAIGRHAKLLPDRIAVVDPAGPTTYAQLWRWACGVAHGLQRQGVRPDDVVAIAATRGAPFVASALGTWLAGATYLPLETAHPKARLRKIIAQSQAAIVVTSTATSGLGADLGATEVQVSQPTGLDAAAYSARSSASGAAYVIYTSGTTGIPKGVLVGQRSLDNLIRWHNQTFGIGPQDVALHTAGLGFDAAVWELWPYLVAGATVVASSDESRMVADFLAEDINAYGCTMAFATTPLAEDLLTGSPDLPTLRHLFTGGDMLRVRPEPGTKFRLVNLYGPAEATVVTTFHEVSPGRLAQRPAIGKPIDNVEVSLRDPDRNPVPEGQEGEVFIGGRGLALGYLNDASLTSARFVHLPGREGLWYRTGDLATADGGVFHFVGRADQEQLKVRGARIEAGEIEAALLCLDGVRSAACVMTPQGDLVALVVSASPWTDSQLRAGLREHLPRSVIPQRFVAVERVPLTANGKIDRRAAGELARANTEGVEQ